MARRKQRPPLRITPAVRPPGRQAATLLHPLKSQGRQQRKDAVYRAHQKHEHAVQIPSVEHPTLADRFHALPGELRERIFSLLLVQPPKWDMEHQPECRCRTHYLDFIPRIPDSGFHCAGYRDLFAWRAQAHYWSLSLRPTWMNPWRSKYAPEKLNPFICSDCYDIRVRHRARDDRMLPCLCARRTELDIMLVCRKWWLEAGHVFYTQNTFCFENSRLLLDFVGMLLLKWRMIITKISLLAKSERGDPISNPDEDKGVLLALKVIRGCSPNIGLCGLTSIELDGLFLTRLRLAKRLMSMGFQDTKVSFILRRPERLTIFCGNDRVFPHFAYRIRLYGGLPEEVGRMSNGAR